MIWLSRVKELLADAIGLDPAAVGPGLIRAAVEERAAALGRSDLKSYVDGLAESEHELQALIERVVVPESWFFRDEQPFTFLRKLARSGWLRDPESPPFRALSIPCARGEEPYSIAIALLETGLPADRITVDAVDVSENALQWARRGIYGPGAFRGKTLAFRNRYFRPIGENFELDRAVRRSVRFLQGNLLDPALLRDEPPYDVIFFRNLLIYLDAASRARAIETIERLLAPSGILFAGHAESLGVLTNRFVPTDEPGSFTYQRNRDDRRPSAQQAPPTPSVRPATPPAPREPHRASPKRSAPTARVHPAVPAKHAPAPPGVSPASPLLERAAELANERRFDDAIRLCEQANRETGPSARSFFLLGTIHQAAGDSELAESCLLKATYLDGQHDEALLALALLAQRRGDLKSAAGYRRRAERAARREGSS
jgi:chemotaxis protein methyltransferase WspC